MELLGSQRARQLVHAHTLDGRLDLSVLGELFDDALQHALTLFNVRCFPPAEQHRHHYLVFVLEEPPGLSDFEPQVVLARPGPQANFLSLGVVGVLMRTFFLFILELAEIHDPAHRWPLVGSHFHQV